MFSTNHAGKLRVKLIEMDMKINQMRRRIGVLERQRTECYERVALCSRMNRIQEIETAANKVQMTEFALQEAQSLLDLIERMKVKVLSAMDQYETFKMMKDMNKHMNALALQNELNKVQKEIQAMSDAMSNASDAASKTKDMVRAQTMNKEKLEQIIRDSQSYASVSIKSMPAVDVQTAANRLAEKLARFDP